MSGPLTQVLDAFRAGAASLADVGRMTGLRPDVVRASVDHLVRLGRMDAKELAAGCPASGCGSCASGLPDGRAGCGASGPSVARTGPVLVALTLRTPPVAAGVRPPA
ncbi:FeoC-like transcriptional regulator [Propioniciclava sp.]|uniref:FeoC-like transcriptional regulator n=1 Tax=Propioniciclava sp. TaxID=2038686 RepID=UPI00261F2CB3|nr:FeoC-like transcriptional regulator [Propioniciclava sp.]